MPRLTRITYQNAYYHIITRGNQKQLVFSDRSDYEKYLSILQRYKKQAGFKLYAYCLMPNHVHLILKIVEPTILSKTMKRINLSYTLYFNFKYKKVGHLWQDRFKSKIINSENYVLDCINYIENNPVRASIAPKATDYIWSSYNSRFENNSFLDDISEL